MRATLESIAYQTRELIDAMEADAGEPMKELRVDGGASANNFLMQFQADILGCRIVRPADIETTALGAAYLAGLATGFWKSVEEVESFWRAERRFEPSMDGNRASGCSPDGKTQLRAPERISRGYANDDEMPFFIGDHGGGVMRPDGADELFPRADAAGDRRR